MRVRCTVQYDGSGFYGFQRQPDRNSVQGTLEAAIARVTQQRVTVVGAGRTDTGVHALGQVVHFDTSSVLSPDKLQRAINACLPDTISLSELVEVPSTFHARFDAISREYRYVVENVPVHSPLLNGRVYHVPAPLVIPAMQRAAATLCGTHDFAAFGSPMSHSRQDELSGEEIVFSGGTVRSLQEARCWGHRRFVFFCFVADAFLRHMVRMLVGTLLRIGSGRLSAETIAGLLRGDSSASAGPAAPAFGLYLVRVRYS